jgi:uncharacterized membrane protein
LETSRVEASSDGVFAVAITLLVLDLRLSGPGRDGLGRQLASWWPSFLAFSVSFFVIGVIWVNHHGLFRDIARVGRTLQFINLMLLVLGTTFPFTTSTLASYLRRGGADAHLAAALCGVTVEGIALSFLALCVRAAHRWRFESHVSTAAAP